MTFSAAEQINTALTKWLYETDKLVVAIDGYTGVGKTTLLNNLAKLTSNVLAVHRDDFLLPRNVVEELINKSNDRSRVFELKINDNKKITELIQAFKSGKAVYDFHAYNPASGELDIAKQLDLSKKVMVIEGVFMFHPKLLNHLWDKRIYLDGDIEAIDTRRIRREKEKWGNDYFPEDHPDSYFLQVIIALKRYQELYKPKEQADLVIHLDI